MVTAIRKSEKATFNYTNRQKIHQRDCQVLVLERTPGNFRLRTILDLNKIKVAEDQALVLEAFYRLLYERFEFNTKKATQDHYLSKSFPTNANPTFRLKLISTREGEEGKVISATTYFGASKNQEEQDSSSAFFSILQADLQGLIWKVDWQDEQNPVVMMDVEFMRKYKIQDDPMSQAFIYPALVKEIVTGILLRFEKFDDLDERQTAAKWLKFCEQKLGMSIPEDPEWSDKEFILSFGDLASAKFAAHKWNGKKTLLEKFLGK